ncbi:MAG: hypothetical protein ACRD98_01640 [Nitrososphaera sp.]
MLWLRHLPTRGSLCLSIIRLSSVLIRYINGSIVFIGRLDDLSNVEARGVGERLELFVGGPTIPPIAELVERGLYEGVAPLRGLDRKLHDLGARKELPNLLNRPVLLLFIVVFIFPS